MWKPITEKPESGRRIVALYGDGSGARLFLTCDAGPTELDGVVFFDNDGDQIDELNDESYCAWTYMPDHMKLWFETIGTEQG